MRTVPPTEKGKYRAIASGAIANGKPVVVNSAGTVSAVSGEAQAVGTAVVFESAATIYCTVVYDASSQKIVIAYQDNANSSYGTAIVGTVSGTSISFGSPVVFASASTEYISGVYDENAQKIVLAYRDGGNSDYGTAIVGTVSGTSISFGSETVFVSGQSSPWGNGAVYDANAQKVVITYQPTSDNTGYAIVGTVSGTSISFGTASQFESGATYAVSTAYDSDNQKVVIAFKDSGDSNHGKALVATVSGTSISFGSAVTFESANTSDTSAVYDPDSQKIVIAFKDGGSTNDGTAIVGTVSGTSISFGSPVVFETGRADESIALYDTNAQKVVIVYQDSDNSDHGTFVVGTVSGTSISFDSPVVFESAETVHHHAAYDANAQKIVTAFRDAGNSNYGTATVIATGKATNLTTENYIGIATGGSYANGQSVTVDVIGTVNDDQSSLTAGQQYFVQEDGTLGLTADSTSVVAGIAISATELIVKE